MDVVINGKKYQFNDDPRWGILELIQTKGDDPKVVKAFLREILIPSPTAKELFEFRRSDIFRIFEEYGKLQEQEDEELKKKRSRSYEVNKLAN